MTRQREHSFLIALYGALISNRSTETTKCGRDLLTTLPSEILFRIIAFMDDVGFVCLRYTHPRLRDMLSIDNLSINPCHKFMIRGLIGVGSLIHQSSSAQSVPLNLVIGVTIGIRDLPLARFRNGGKETF